MAKQADRDGLKIAAVKEVMLEPPMLGCGQSKGVHQGRSFSVCGIHE
ncbi:hypothetical protein [Brevundimonas denitrificans]|uniref:Uncharacterized protein n=1 Tax=Brevundimonas abyssalis TAR-001 TaxID=1391729 RepID=A0A8E0NAN4_9CAUL|nr:hypothetical protein [Brevundimonas denitrificans]GAD58606.1 hypothetical protein MBEBAB_0856 [Brevundimonas abyssalis TAR-001]